MFSEVNGKKNKFKWLWPWLIIVLVSLMALSPQIIGSHMIIGEDCWFHMNRAYESMEQLKTGHFSYFLNLFSFNSSGRIVNGLYGPVGSYLEGCLLLIVKTWYRWELLNSLLVLVVAGLSMYYVARKLNVSYWPSILAGVFYLSSFPFDRWVINQNFDGFGAMLLPWFLWAGYRIFRHQFNPVKLAFLVAIMSQIHLMSTLIGIVSLLISFVMANCYSGRLKLWLKGLESAALGLLMTVNVWGSILEVKTSNHVVPPVPYHAVLSTNHAIYGWIVMKPIVNHIITELIGFMIIGLIWVCLRHANVAAKFFVVQGLIFLWLSSKYFPWALLLKHQSMLASYLQFPERFLPVAIAAILLVIVQLRPKLMIIIGLTLLVIINAGFDVKTERATVNSQYHSLMKSSWNVVIKRPTSFQHLENTLHSDDSDAFIKLTENRVPDYMPIKTKINQSNQYYRIQPDKLNIREIINNKMRIQRSIVGRNVERMRFKTEPGHEITVPFVKYGHTALWLNHRSIKPDLTQIHAIRLRPDQKNNVLDAQYQPSHWYEALVFVEIVTWLSLIVDEITRRLMSRRI